MNNNRLASCRNKSTFVNIIDNINSNLEERNRKTTGLSKKKTTLGKSCCKNFSQFFVDF